MKKRMDREAKRRTALRHTSDRRTPSALSEGAVRSFSDLNRRFIAAFLALVFAISCMVVGFNFATKAADSDGFNMLESSDDNGLVLRKGLKDNGDGTYDLKMEAYATGTTATQTLESDAVLKDIVTDNFDTTNATVSVATVAGTYNADSDPTWGAATTTSDNVTYSWSGQTLSVTGFDYGDTFIADGNPGEKLVVTISGLTRSANAQAEADNRIYSNDPASGVYKNASEAEPFGALPRPSIETTTNLVPAGKETGVTDAASGMVLNKYLTANENGMYDLTMEAYSTASTTSVTEKIPTDFVVVVDQSGSMSTADMPTGDPTAAKNVYLETAAGGSYYYYDSTTDNYYRVYGVKDYLYRYYEANYWYVGDLIDRFGTDLGWFMSNTESTTTFENQMYFREVVGGKTYYQPITMTVQGKIGTYYIKFNFDSKQTGKKYWFDREVTQYSSNSNSPWYLNLLTKTKMTDGATWSLANAAVQTLYPDDNAYTYSQINLGLAKPNTGMYINYPMYDRHVGYTKLCYRDINGVEHEVPSNNNNGQSSWEFCNANGQALTAQSGSRPTYSGLYTYGSTTTRLAALKNALSEFAEAVAAEEDTFGAVDNRISIVGFSSRGNSYTNTELLTGENLTVSNNNGVQKDDATTSDYATALVSANNGTVGTVNSKITAAINAITANGGTQPEDGLSMAYQILTNRSTTDYTIRSGENRGQSRPRNKIVIFFTDGQPGNYHYSDQYAEANDVVEAAKPIKDYDASLFSIGVFGESDGNPLTYSHASASSVDPNWKYLGGWMENYYDSYNRVYHALRRQWRSGADGYTEKANDTIFDYMSVTSSNYPDAEEYIAPTWLSGTFSGTYTQATEDVRSQSTAESTNKYYRMASNQDTLVAAFMQAVTMMNDEVSGDMTLGTSTLLRDILKENTFAKSTNTSIRCETFTGTASSNGTITFDDTPNQNSASSLVASLGDQQVEVEGFDYSTNCIYYGKAADSENGLGEHQGRKLVVTLTNIQPVGSVTSNNGLLYSNEDTSGILKSDGELVAAFPKPAITRHSYTLDVGEANTSAEVNVTTTLVAGSGASSDLSDVIFVAPDGTRSPYTSIQDETFNMTNGQAFYFENVPSGYTVSTSAKAKDNDYTYTFWENDESSTASTLSTDNATERTLQYSDNVLHVTSVANYRTVTLQETVSGDYANEDDEFSVTLTLTPPSGTDLSEAANTLDLGDGVTLTKDAQGTAYEGSVSGLPGDGTAKTLNQVPYNWTLVVTPVAHDRYDVADGYPKYTTTDPAGAETAYPAAGLTITSGTTDIVIHNVAKDIPITGIIDDSHHNRVIYILAGAGVLAAGAGAAYVYRRKDEFAGRER